MTPAWVPGGDPGYLTAVPTVLQTKVDAISEGADVTPVWVPSADPGYLTA